MLALLTIIAGAFICVAGTYVSIKVSVRSFRRCCKALIFPNPAHRGRIQWRDSRQAIHMLDAAYSRAVFSNLSCRGIVGLSYDMGSLLMFDGMISRGLCQ
jgi:hypothetical protein